MPIAAASPNTAEVRVDVWPWPLTLVYCPEIIPTICIE